MYWRVITQTNACNVRTMADGSALGWTEFKTEKCVGDVILSFTWSCLPMPANLHLTVRPNRPCKSYNKLANIVYFASFFLSLPKMFLFNTSRNRWILTRLNIWLNNYLITVWTIHHLNVSLLLINLPSIEIWKRNDIKLCSVVS